GEPMTIASDENRSSAVTCPTRLSTTVVPGRLLAPSPTASAIRSVFPDSEWYATNTLTAARAGSSAETEFETSATWETIRQKTKQVRSWSQLSGITAETFPLPYALQQRHRSRRRGDRSDDSARARIRSTFPVHRTADISGRRTRLSHNALF